MKTTKQHNLSAFTLAEILLSMALFALLVSSVGVFAVEAVRASKNSAQRVVAVQYMQEMKNALLLSKDKVWGSIIGNTGLGSYHLIYQDGTYSFAPGAESRNGISVSFSITEVQRDASGNIVPTGTVDNHTRAVNLLTSWTDYLGIVNTITATTYVSDWTTLRLLQTTDTEFNTGTKTDTIVTKVDNGEVKLVPMLYADWCKPSLTQTAHDLPGQGIAKSLFVTQGNIYMGTGSNASGVSFAHLSFAPSEPPVVQLQGLFDGYKTNAIASDGTYGYLATQTNSSEIVITNLSGSTFSEVGYFNPTENTQGKGVAVVGNVGYMITPDRLYSFNLTSKTGSRPAISHIDLNGSAVDLFVRGNYAYIAVTGATIAVQIVDISNPSSLQSVGSITVSGMTPRAVYVNEAGNRAYVAMAASSTQREVYFVDVTSKTGNKTPYASYETNGMSPTDITSPEGSNRVMVAGIGGTEQYQVINIINESSPQYCGGLTVTNGVNAVLSQIESNGNAYSYIVTSDSNAELKVIRGGLGGGDGEGHGYAQVGEYTSQIFDMTSTTTQYYGIDWNASIPASTTARMQVRSGASPTLSGAIWVGPDGTNTTYFTVPQGAPLPSVLNNNRYFQYKISFTSDTISTPIFNQVEITYQK